MIPLERSLVRRLVDEPFALIGVNSDKDRKKLKQDMEKEQITWRSFWNGGSPFGPISTRWDVRAWPTIYVIDATGTIRFKSPDETQLDKIIDGLLTETRAAQRGK